MKRLIMICCLLCATLTLWASEPITFSGGATKLVMKEGRQSISLSGGARVTSGSIQLSAESITLSGEEYRFVTCTGSVRLIDSERGLTLTTRTLSYDRQNEQILVPGYVEIDDAKTQVQASAFHLAYDIEAGQMELEVSAMLLRHTSSGAMVCSSDVITFNRSDERLSMFGNARVVWDDDTYEAQRIDVDLKAEEIVMKGAIKGVIGG